VQALIRDLNDPAEGVRQRAIHELRLKARRLDAVGGQDRPDGVGNSKSEIPNSTRAEIRHPLPSTFEIRISKLPPFYRRAVATGRPSGPRIWNVWMPDRRASV